MTLFEDDYELFNTSIEKDEEIIQKIQNNFENHLELLVLLKDKLQDSNEIEKCSKFIAELAKEESLREKITQTDEVLSILNEHLNNKLLSNSTKIQLCRAIGNICYYNDNARLKLLNSSDGLGPIISLIQHLSQQEISVEDELLIVVALGCLHNISNENETLSNELAKHQILTHLKDLVKKYLSRNNLNIFKYLISCLENLVELNSQIKEEFTTLNLAQVIYDNINEDFLVKLDDSQLEELFEFFDFINNLKNVRKSTCETDFIDLILNLMSNSSNVVLVRYCGLFITTLLTSDSSAEDEICIILEYKSRLVLNFALEWLNGNTEQLYLTASVILANYTRSDKDVALLVKHDKKPHMRLISLIKSYSTLDAEQQKLEKINLVHSLLGAMRNLCVSMNHRKEFVENNIIDIVLPYLLNWSNLDVNFKAIAIIRLLIKMCTRDIELKAFCEFDVLQTVSDLALKCEHPGVKGEASRLVCYLGALAIKHPTLDLFSKFQQTNIYKVMINQLKSEHLIMTNEALLSLNLCVNFAYELCHEKLKEYDLNDALKNVLEKDKVPIEVQNNLMKLLGFLIEKKNFLTHEQLDTLSTYLKQKLQNGDVDSIIGKQMDQMLVFINANN